MRLGDRKEGLCLAHGNPSQTQAGRPPRTHVLPAPAGPALTLPCTLRVPQLSLEAHARELFGAGPLGCTRGGSRAVLAARGLPLRDSHDREGGGARGSTPGAPRQKEASRLQLNYRGPHMRRNGRGWREGRGLRKNGRRKGRVLGGVRRKGRGLWGGRAEGRKLAGVGVGAGTESSFSLLSRSPLARSPSGARGHSAKPQPSRGGKKPTSAPLARASCPRSFL